MGRDAGAEWTGAGDENRDPLLDDDLGDDEARRRLLTTRLIEGLSVAAVATVGLLSAEVSFNYSRSRFIPVIQLSTLVLLAAMVRVLSRRPPLRRVIGIGWAALGVMPFGTAMVGTIDQEAFTTSSLIIALAMMSTTLLPWGWRAQLGGVVPMALAYSYVMVNVTETTAWGPRLPFGIAAVLGASVYIAYHLERERTTMTAERRRRAEENRSLMRELQRANDTKSEFVATMSHELRTPLNVILGYNDLLREEALGATTADQKEALERVRANALELLDLVNATLDLNRLEAGSMVVHAQRVTLAELAQEVDTQVRMLCADGVELRWVVPPDLPAVFCDVAKLKVILKNLTTNALKFTARGSVEISFAMRATTLVIAVTDTGIGIAPDAAKLVFEPFQQADPSIQRTYGGAGLGLHIVKRLVNLMNGSIELESAPGQGTTMRVQLPLTAVDRVV